MGRRVDPAWVAWAEEQTVKLLEARRQLRDLSDGPRPAPEPPEDDPIRLVEEIHLDEGRPKETAPIDQRSAGAERQPGGRRLVVRVHHENLES